MVRLPPSARARERSFGASVGFRINIPRNRASIYLDNRNPVYALMVRVSETPFTSHLEAIGSSLETGKPRIVKAIHGGKHRRRGKNRRREV